ncbi:hypothetical protein TNIN_322321 [Trichonephila inaurata madagascariensis]|uniref:Uncharacterized protein n=1 Tax=Trichonephila inaurata madagascariensis TaxID=2747483 RepID=A0A8X7BWD1_9ARAC|nr:hypothetical protein TNIN_322321 [Trichonephila inaurata madagascariensis]
MNLTNPHYHWQSISGNDIKDPTSHVPALSQKPLNRLAIGMQKMVLVTTNKARNDFKYNNKPKKRLPIKASSMNLRYAEMEYFPRQTENAAQRCEMELCSCE